MVHSYDKKNIGSYNHYTCKEFPGRYPYRTASIWKGRPHSGGPYGHAAGIHGRAGYPSVCAGWCMGSSRQLSCSPGGMPGAFRLQSCIIFCGWVKKRPLPCYFRCPMAGIAVAGPGLDKLSGDRLSLVTVQPQRAGATRNKH